MTNIWMPANGSGITTWTATSTNTSPDITPPDEHARRTVTLDSVEWRKAQNGRSDNFTLRGHAAIFNSISDDLGGFRELIAPGAFRSALRGNPDVRLLFNHDPNKVLARTTASIDGKPSLELREDATGLHVWAVIQPRSWVNDLAIEMAGGLIDQMSFAFTLRDEGSDEWAVTEDGTVVRTILPDGIDALYDVSVVTFPAYSATQVGMRELRNAVHAGRLPASVLGEPDQDQIDAATAERSAVTSSPQEALLAEPAEAAPTVADLRERSRKALQDMRHRHLMALKELK